MRWVPYDYSVHGVFAREVLPEDKEFLLTHKDTFKRMWHEQTPMYWIRLVVTLRSFVNANIYEEGFWEKLALPRTVFTALLDACYVTICQKFALDTFGGANEFLSSIMLVVANIGMMCHIGSKSIANDPFYCIFSRDSYRELFGSPTPSSTAQIKAYVMIPVFSRFAAAVVALLRQWIRARDMPLRDFYHAYRQNPYWPTPKDWCPSDPFADFLLDYEWIAPSDEELSMVLKNDPDRHKSLQDLSKLFGMNDNEYSTDGSTDEDEDSLDIIFCLMDALMLESPGFEENHIDASCTSCRERDMNPIEQVLNDMQTELAQECTGALFWKQERIMRILTKAENKFQNQVKKKGIKLRTDLKNIPPKKESKKRRVVPSDDKEARELPMSGRVPVKTTQVSATKPSPNVCRKKNGGTSREAIKQEARCMQSNKMNSNESSAADEASLQKEKRCATCGKSGDLKLKRCALCVQKGFQDPVRYCSRECQVRNWEEKHQYVHQQDEEIQ